ncbi:3-hydroxyacyl-CoA dehydrogenase [Limosilactobacillus kribbianus]|uniref:3-hydroxyacyl-CoA dehydrogenase n=1 Tax=Limosilactobacillus kribbianus TaxID=2982695 RepID=UPI002264530F|nr:3-hydroxyacyl-CoA dehydrogenase [Limosilactobacillus kribbianus]
MSFRNVTVAGTGVLGSQIAYQTALNGFKVTAYDLDADAAKKRVLALESSYQHDLHLTAADFQKGLDNLTFTTDLQTAVQDADFVIEALPEELEVKEKFYQQLSKVAPAKAIFASNSSTMIPSQLVKYVDRPAKFLNMHFANMIWLCNVAEIMGTSQTNPAVFQAVVDFAHDIKMVPIAIRKEQPGYVLNSLLIPFVVSAMSLWAKGVADPATVDKDWMISTGAPVGPFAMLDDVGLHTVKNIMLELYQTRHSDLFKQIADKLQPMIDEGKTGVTAGEGFYKYPHPAFRDPEFLKK